MYKRQVLGLFAGCGNSNTTPAGTAAAANPTAANPTAAAAADSLDGTSDITVWVSEMAGVKELTEQQIKDFMEENPGIVINATIEDVYKRQFHGRRPELPLPSDPRSAGWRGCRRYC